MPGRRPLYRLPRPHVRRVEAAAISASCTALNYRPVTLLVLVGVIAATGLMYMTSQGSSRRKRTRASCSPGEDACTPISTISRTPPGSSTRSTRRCREGTCSPSTAWATCTRVSPASCSSLGASGRGARRGADEPSRASRYCHGPGDCLLAAGAPRLGRRTADPVRYHHDARRPRARRRACRCREVGARKRHVMLGFRPSASRRRRSSFTSTTTRRTGSASRWPISAARWRRCSAAITSICSTFTGAVIA